MRMGRATLISQVFERDSSLIPGPLSAAASSK
jgi:hypothetical protein